MTEIVITIFIHHKMTENYDCFLKIARFTINSVIVKRAVFRKQWSILFQTKLIGIIFAF